MRSAIGVPIPLQRRKMFNPGFAFTPVPNEFSSTVIVTADATPHTAGAWTQLIAATVADSSWLMVGYNNTAAASADTRSLLDIAYGAAASEVMKINSIPVGFSAINGFSMITIPIWCPLGTRISARLRAFVTVDTANIRLAPMRETNAAFKAATFVDTYGHDTAASRGTNLLTSDTYVELTSATTAPYRGLIMAPGGGLGSSQGGESSLYTMAVGASGAEVVIATQMVTTTTSEQLWSESPVTVTPGHFPKGTRIACKQATGRNYRDVIVFGIPYA